MKKDRILDFFSNSQRFKFILENELSELVESSIIKKYSRDTIIYKETTRMY